MTIRIKPGKTKDRDKLKLIDRLAKVGKALERSQYMGHFHCDKCSLCPGGISRILSIVYNCLTEKQK